MSVGDIFRLLKDGSGVFYRYFFTPSRLLGPKTGLVEVLSFLVLTTGFYVALPFLEFYSSIELNGEPVTDQSFNKFSFQVLVLLCIVLLAVMLSSIQWIIGRIRRSNTKYSIYLYSALYCFTIVVFVMMIYTYLSQMLVAFGPWDDATWLFRGSFAVILVAFAHMIFVNIRAASDRRSVSYFWVGWAVLYGAILIFTGAGSMFVDILTD